MSSHTSLPTSLYAETRGEMKKKIRPSFISHVLVRKSERDFCIIIVKIRKKMQIPVINLRKNDTSPHHIEHIHIYSFPIPCICKSTLKAENVSVR